MAWRAGFLGQFEVKFTHQLAQRPAFKLDDRRIIRQGDLKALHVDHIGCHQFQGDAVAVVDDDRALCGGDDQGGLLLSTHCPTVAEGDQNQTQKKDQ